MKILIFFLTCFLLFCTDAQAIGRRHKYRGAPRTEVELMTQVLNCLRYKDSIEYYNLFPPLDTLWRMVTHSTDQSPQAQKELAELRDHPTVLIDMDPFYNHSIIARFSEVLRKGEDSGINWQGIIMQRFELQKQGTARGLEGLTRIAPERFKGYLFVRDMLSSTTFCITISEIEKINGFFCGGQVINVLEANTTDMFRAKEVAERKLASKIRQIDQQRQEDSARADTGVLSFAYRDSLRMDSIRVAAIKLKNSGPQLPVDSAKIKRDIILSSGSSATDDDNSKVRREVVDRKLYKGKFDDDIPVELYVRYMKNAEGKINHWDGLYKFGDMPQYIRLEISKSDDGVWLMEEPVGLMELELRSKAYVGSWTNGENQTGYDVELAQKDLSQAKMKKLDDILDNNLGGSTSAQKITEKKDTADKKAAPAYKDPLQDPTPIEEEKPKEKEKPKDIPVKKYEPKKEDDE